MLPSCCNLSCSTARFRSLRLSIVLAISEHDSVQQDGVSGLLQWLASEDNADEETRFVANVLPYLNAMPADVYAAMERGEFTVSFMRWGSIATSRQPWLGHHNGKLRHMQTVAASQMRHTERSSTHWRRGCFHQSGRLAARAPSLP